MLQVLEVVRSNYDTLTLKLQDGLDQYERYSEQHKEAAFFKELVSVSLSAGASSFDLVAWFVEKPQQSYVFTHPKHGWSGKEAHALVYFSLDHFQLYAKFLGFIAICFAVPCVLFDNGWSSVIESSSFFSQETCFWEPRKSHAYWTCNKLMKHIFQQLY